MTALIFHCVIPGLHWNNPSEVSGITQMPNWSNAVEKQVMRIFKGLEIRSVFGKTVHYVETFSGLDCGLDCMGMQRNKPGLGAVITPCVCSPDLTIPYSDSNQLIFQLQVPARASSKRFLKPHKESLLHYCKLFTRESGKGVDNSTNIVTIICTFKCMSRSQPHINKTESKCQLPGEEKYQLSTRGSSA